MLGGANGEQDVVHDALGRPLGCETISAAEHRRGRPDSRSMPRSRARPRRRSPRSAQHYTRQGRDRDRDEPEHRRRPARWRTGRASTRRTSPTPPSTSSRTAPPASPTSPGPPSRPSRSPGRSRSTWSPRTRSFYLPSRSRSPTGRSGSRRARARRSTLTVAQILAQSSNVGAVTIGLKVGADRLRASGSTASASASRPASTIPGEEQGIVPVARRLLGLDDGQPADRPGPLGHPDADGRRRTRRSPTAASCAVRRLIKRSEACQSHENLEAHG